MELRIIVFLIMGMVMIVAALFSDMDYTYEAIDNQMSNFKADYALYVNLKYLKFYLESIDYGSAKFEATTSSSLGSLGERWRKFFDLWKEKGVDFDKYAAFFMVGKFFKATEEFRNPVDGSTYRRQVFKLDQRIFLPGVSFADVQKDFDRMSAIFNTRFDYFLKVHEIEHSTFESGLELKFEDMAMPGLEEAIRQTSTYELNVLDYLGEADYRYAIACWVFDAPSLGIAFPDKFKVASYIRWGKIDVLPYVTFEGKRGIELIMLFCLRDGTEDFRNSFERDLKLAVAKEGNVVFKSFEFFADGTYPYELVVVKVPFDRK